LANIFCLLHIGSFQPLVIGQHMCGDAHPVMGASNRVPHLGGFRQGMLDNLPHLREFG
jgi:hypothetical protein